MVDLHAVVVRPAASTVQRGRGHVGVSRTILSRWHAVTPTSRAEQSGTRADGGRSLAPFETCATCTSCASASSPG
eukprot:658414-Prymnesium_polylepis.1